MFGPRALFERIFGGGSTSHGEREAALLDEQPKQLDPPAHAVRARARHACVISDDDSASCTGVEDSPAPRAFCASPDSREFPPYSADCDDTAPAPSARPGLVSRAGEGKTGRVNAPRRDPMFEQTVVYEGKDRVAADQVLAKMQEDICGPAHKLITDGYGGRERKDGSTCEGFLCTFKNPVHGGCGWRCRRVINKEGIIKIETSDKGIPHAPHTYIGNPAVAQPARDASRATN